MASTTDKFRKAFNSANPVTTYVTSSRSSGATTLSCNNLAGWPTDTAVDFVTYQLGTDGTTPVAGTQIDWKGIVSGSNITNLTRVAGATDTGSAVNDVVEAMPTASWGNDLITGILNFADQDATLKAGAIDNAAVLASNVVETAKIKDANVTAAKLADDAVTAAKSAVFPLATDVRNISTNTTISDPHIQSGWSFIAGTGASFVNTTLTFPVAFDSAPSCVQFTFIGRKDGSDPTSISELTLATDLTVYANTITATGCNLTLESISGTTQASGRRLGFSWFAMGPKAR